jgi:hypothetical protein
MTAVSEWRIDYAVKPIAGNLEAAKMPEPVGQADHELRLSRRDLDRRRDEAFDFERAADLARAAQARRRHQFEVDPEQMAAAMGEGATISSTERDGSGPSSSPSR